MKENLNMKERKYVLWIESAEELDRGWFEGRQRIGIAAGASTPEWLITEISNKIARM